MPMINIEDDVLIAPEHYQKHVMKMLDRISHESNTVRSTLLDSFSRSQPARAL